MTTTLGIRAKQVEFYSDGTRVAGDLFLPPDADVPGPGVVVCHGFGGIKEFFLGDIAQALAGHGFAALTLDYRGFGDSDGQQGRLFPEEQVEDVRAAVRFLAAQPEVSGQPVGIYGTSFGGGIAVAAGCKQPEVKAVISAVGIADCGRWLRSLRRHWEWLEFEERLRQDRIRRLVTGESELVEPEEIMVRDPASEEHERHLRELYPRRAFRLTLESADAIAAFRPVDALKSPHVPALMFVGVEGDGLTPYSETVDFYERCAGPKELLTLSGMTHHDVYKPQNLYGVMEAVAAFLRQHLGA